MKIVVTGSEGFIGTHVRRLLPEDAEVVRIDMMEERVHGAEEPDFEVFTEPSAWAYEECKDADVLIHLAAQVGVADSMTDTDRYVLENTADTAALLADIATLSSPPRRIVVASSMSIYGDPLTSTPITEDHAVLPVSVYGLTKFDQERLAIMYGEQMGVPVTALRFFNVYGPGQAVSNPYTGVLAIFANALLAGEAPTVFEDGLQTRDFVYVEDVAKAVVTAALTDVPGVFNISTGTPTTILDVATLLADVLGVDIAPTITYTKRPGDIRHCVGSSEAFRRETGWSPRPLRAGMEELVSALRAGVRRPSDLAAYLAPTHP